MRDLYNYIAASSKDATIIADYDLKKVPGELGKIYDDVQSIAEGQAKEAVLKGVRDWYKDNQNRRNIIAGTGIQAVFYVVDPDNKLLMDVVRELKRIGVHGESGEWEPVGKWSLGGVECGRCSIQLSVATYKQFNADNYKFTVSNGVYGPTFKKTTQGNGYNSLPAEDMTALRQKLYDCMTGTKVEVKSLPRGKRDLEIPTFIFALTAQYDKRKLKELLNFLRNDKRYQNFADRMDDMSRGIEAYYASKRPGEYVGD